MCLFLLSLYLSGSYNMISTRDSSSKSVQLRHLSDKHHYEVSAPITQFYKERKFSKSIFQLKNLNLTPCKEAP